MNQNALSVDYPKTPEAQLKWLMDRACITELLSAYSRALDRKDYDTLVSCFVHDGVLELPFGVIPAKELGEAAQAALGCYEITQHINVPHSIVIEGDEAYVWQSIVGIHVPKRSDLANHGDVGAWYEMTLVRTSAGWRFKTIKDFFVWTLGTGFPGSPEHGELLKAHKAWSPEWSRS